ncbi:MAG: hypothetical protein AAF517_10935 [Planctomycetota bacterium]
MRKSLVLTVLSVSALLFANGCTFVSKATEFNGIPGAHGKDVEYYSATKVGMHFLFVFPLVGDVSVPSAIDEMTQQVKKDNGQSVRMVQTSSSTLWYVFMPLTFFVQPVVTSVSAEVEVDPAAADDAEAAE